MCCMVAEFMLAEDFKALILGNGFPELLLPSAVRSEPVLTSADFEEHELPILRCSGSKLK